MPKFTAKTVSSEKVWASPDGQKTIYKVMLEVGGKQAEAKTYSDAISAVGWQGEAETYEKQGRNGTETFVKQPPKEGYAGGGGQARSYGGQAKPQFDNFTMYLSYAKDLVVASIHEGKFNGDLYDSLLTATAAGGVELYASRPGADPVPTVEPNKEELNVALADVGDFFVDAEPADQWAA